MSITLNLIGQLLASNSEYIDYQLHNVCEFGGKEIRNHLNVFSGCYVNIMSSSGLVTHHSVEEVN